MGNVLGEGERGREGGRGGGRGEGGWVGGVIELEDLYNLFSIGDHCVTESDLPQSTCGVFLPTQPCLDPQTSHVSVLPDNEVFPETSEVVWVWCCSGGFMNGDPLSGPPCHPWEHVQYERMFYSSMAPAQTLITLMWDGHAHTHTHTYTHTRAHTHTRCHSW